MQTKIAFGWSGLVDEASSVTAAYVTSVTIRSLIRSLDGGLLRIRLPRGRTECASSGRLSALPSTVKTRAGRGG